MRTYLALTALVVFSDIACGEQRIAFDALDFQKKSALNQLVKTQPITPWVRQFIKDRTGAGTGFVTFFELEGKKYEMHSSCKSHQCPRYQFSVVFGPDSKSAWAVDLNIPEGKLLFVGDLRSDVSSSVLDRLLQEMGVRQSGD